MIESIELGRFAADKEEGDVGDFFPPFCEHIGVVLNGKMWVGVVVFRVVLVEESEAARF